MSGLLGTAATLLGRLALRPASWRGVPFGVAGLGKDGGRRWITHRYPKRDKVQHEDLGLKERIIAVEGFVVGSDYAARLLRLEAAFDQAGAGRLVHPYYGELQLVCTGYRMHSGLEQGLVSFQALFEIEDGASPAPVQRTNGPALLDRLGLSGVAELVDEYGRYLTLDGLQDFVGEQLGDLLGGFGLSLSDLASVYGLYQQVRGTVALLGAFTGGGGTSGGVTAAASSAAVTAGVAALAPAGRRPDAPLRLAASSGIPMPPAPLVATPSRIAAGHNAAALDELVRASAAVQAARAGATVAWDSRDEAIRYRDQVGDALDEAADRVGALGWDASWRALLDLRAAWMPHISTTAAQLPRVRTITLTRPMSALQLAYQLDGDDLSTLFARAEDIARRNSIPNPAFLPVGVPLEVLANG